jgi:hypothetical protein
MLKVRHSCVRVFFSFSKFVFNFWPAFACWAFCLIGGDLLAGASSHHVGFDLRSRNRACVRKNNFQRMVSWLKEVFYLNFAKSISKKRIFTFNPARKTLRLPIKKVLCRHMLICAPCIG